MLRYRILQIEQLVGHLCDDLSGPFPREDTVIPEIVVKRPTDMDEIKLVVTIVVGERCTKPVFSDCVDGIKVGRYLVQSS